MRIPLIDLRQNVKQQEFFRAVMNACAGHNQYRYFAYGGAIRGGKSFITAYILIELCLRYPGSRWYVIRQDMPVLITTTIPTFQKLLKKSKQWTWHRDKSNFHIKHRNGSIIIFKGENIIQDPLLNDFLGLEANGIWLEQAEELSETMWHKALERTGSWYINPMPPAFIFLTFNPSQEWVKDKFYAPYVKGELKEPFFFQQALPKDNPFVTPDQWTQWENMADAYQQQFIHGNWASFENKNNLWAYAYNPVRHSRPPLFDKSQTVFLSFDFNVNPMCCSVIQWYNNCIGVMEVIKLPNSGTEALCRYIRASRYWGCNIRVTGDACGAHRHASQRDNMDSYTIIQNMLNLKPHQINVPAVNPPLANNRVLVNSILEKMPVFIDATLAQALHYDLANVRCNPDNTIIKSNRAKAQQQSDALDTFRYFCNMYFYDFVKTIR